MKEKIFIPVLPSGSSSRSRKGFVNQVQTYVVENDLHKKCYCKGSRLKLKVAFHYFSPNHTKDIDNSLKGLLDALKGYLFGDDRNIWDIHATIVAPSDKIGIELRIFSTKALREQEKKNGPISTIPVKVKEASPQLQDWIDKNVPKVSKKISYSVQRKYESRVYGHILTEEERKRLYSH